MSCTCARYTFLYEAMRKLDVVAMVIFYGCLAMSTVCDILRRQW